MSRTVPLVGLLAAALVAAPVDAWGQDFRVVTSQRQRGAEQSLVVKVQYGAGQLTVRPAPEGTLYRTRLRYDGESFQPVTSYEGGQLRIGVEGQGRMTVRRRQMGELDLWLGPSVPLNLDFQFGAAKAELELGGLHVERAEISTGASETTLRFSRPNAGQGERLSLSAGAAAFRAYGLGNANVRQVRVEGGVGDILLDFSGEWHADLAATVKVGLGALTLNLPRGIGVRLVRESVLSTFDAGGLIREADGYYSEDWGSASRKLTLRLDAAFGAVNVRWVDAAHSIP